MNSAISPTSLDQTLQATTASVIESIFLYVLGIPFPYASDIDNLSSEIFKKSQHSSFDVVLDLISAFTQIDVRAMHMASDLRAQSFMHMIAVLERDFKFKGRVHQLSFHFFL